MKEKQVVNPRYWLAELIDQATDAGLITRDDRFYAANQLSDRLQLEGDPWNRTAASGRPDAVDPSIALERPPSIPELLDNLTDDAVARGVLEDLHDLRDRLQADLMNVFLDKPSTVNQQFWTLYQKSPRQATDWFYHMSQASNYIQTRQIAKNIVYQAKTEYGDLDITINLSKPEKNPRDIAAARNKPNSGYPACQLCVENEGYAGRIGYPARANHRMIRLELAGEPWYFQYSPYSYYPEHCIILSEYHRDMVINTLTFTRLLAFVTRFPHYFAGSNADLPIVGGSILTHDHYQGGCYELPMARAKTAFVFDLPLFNAVKCSVLHWPMSVLRLQCRQPEPLVGAADMILKTWRAYSDQECDIIAFSGDTPHNTITPIARRRHEDYELDLVLRNNRQSAEHPLGIFHPHADVHHIKKENIGLIEVMGLAVLPARLRGELAAVEDDLCGRPADIAAYHQAWAEELKKRHPQIMTPEEAEQAVRRGVAEKFERVLADAGLYKRNESGQAGWLRFVAHLQKQGC